MVKLGVIGRNFVVDWLLEAAEKVPEIRPVAVCSRDPEAAKPFAEQYQMPYGPVSRESEYLHTGRMYRFQ